MDWPKAKKSKEEGAFVIPGEWLFLHYYEALNVLFRIENALRIFVYVILKNELEEKWIEFQIPSDDAGQDTIRSVSSKRLNQARGFGFLGYPITCPLMHLTGGELIRLITSEMGWRYFSKYFYGKREIISNKLEEIGSVRNTLAHFRPIRSDDVDLVKQHAKHALMGVEKCLTQVFGNRDVVPTNTGEDWYKELTPLSTENCKLSFFQSEDEEWIRIRLRYDCPIAHKRQVTSEFKRYRVLNLVSPAILNKYQALSNTITYLTEEVPGLRTPKVEEPSFRKDIFLVFSRNVLRNKYKRIGESLKELFEAIATETKLIEQDHLAKGEFIKAVTVDAYLRKPEENAYWLFQPSQLSCEVRENDPVEFWGNLDPLYLDFLSSAEKYPWMPTTVSEGNFPPF